MTWRVACLLNGLRDQNKVWHTAKFMDRPVNGLVKIKCYDT